MEKINLKFIVWLAAILSSFLALSQTKEKRLIRSTFNVSEYQRLYENVKDQEGMNRVEPAVELIQYYFQNTNESGIPDSILRLYENLDLDTKTGTFLKNPFPLLYLKLHRSYTNDDELESMKVGSQILELNQPLSVKDSFIVYNTLFYAYLHRGLYHFQLDLIPTISRLAEKTGFGEYHWYPNSIWYAKIYYDLGYIDEAVFAYKECAQVALDSNDLYMNSNFLNNVGVVFKKHFKYDSALFYFNMCEKQIQAYLNPLSLERDTAMLEIVRANIADCYFGLGHFKESLEIQESLLGQNSKNTLSINDAYRFFNIAKCYIELNELQNAKTYINEGQRLLGNENRIRFVLPLYEVLLLYAKATGDFKTAFMWQQKVSSIKDSIYTDFERQRTQALSAMSLFETRKKELLIAQNKAAKIAIDLNLQQQKIDKEQQKTTWLVVLAVILILLLGMAFLAYKRKQKSEFILNQKSQELAYSKLEVEQALVEKNTLLKEVHHRVKNNLQVISSILHLQSYQAKTSELKLGLEESQKRIQAMYLVHQKLYESNLLDEMPIGDYLKELCQGVVIGMKPDDFQLDLDVVCGTQKFNLDTSIPLGLIVNELMTNALKHAYKDCKKGKITIHLTKAEGRSFELVFKDDGVGMPKKLNIKGTESLGLKLVQILAQQLQGEITYAYKNGAQFNLHFRI